MWFHSLDELLNLALNKLQKQREKKAIFFPPEDQGILKDYGCFMLICVYKFVKESI